MRINNINSRISFRKFMDSDAQKAVREVFMEKPTQWKKGESLPKVDSDQEILDGEYKMLRDCDYFEIYTDKETGIIKGRFSDEFVKSTEDHKGIKSEMKDMMKYTDYLGRKGIVTDVFNHWLYGGRCHLYGITRGIRNIDSFLRGVDPHEEFWKDFERFKEEERKNATEEVDYATMRAYEEAYR